MTQLEKDKISDCKRYSDRLKAENAALREEIAAMKAEKRSFDKADEEVFRFVRENRKMRQRRQVIDFIPVRETAGTVFAVPEFEDYALADDPVRKPIWKRVWYYAMLALAVCGCVAAWIGHRIGWVDILSAITVTVMAILCMGMGWLM